MTRDLAHLSATDLARGYRDGSFTPTEVVTDVLATIEALDGRLNAFCVVDGEHARSRAAEADARFEAGVPIGPMDGVPVSVKDVVLTAPWETRRGSKALPAAQPGGVDGPSAAALHAAGAVTVGKTTTPEIGWKAVTDNPLTGVTRNPWDLSLTPGGSSGGASAAVAAGMGAIAVGTDGGGSVRIPAAFTGVVGVKPSRGMVPLWPASPFGLLSHVGPLTRTVDDAALAMSVMGRPDVRDRSFAHDRFEPVPADLRALPLDGLRLGYCLDHPDLPTDPQVRRVLEDALATLEDGGARLLPVTLGLDGVGATFRTLWFVGAAAATQDAVRDELDPGLATVAEQGAAMSAVDYHRAVQRRETLVGEMHQLLDEIDFLITPTVPILPFEAGQEVPQGWHDERWPSWTPFTWPFNVTGQPAISVPAGLAECGLPVGLQAVGRYGEDARLLRFAKAYEAARGEHPVPAPAH